MESKEKNLIIDFDIDKLVKLNDLEKDAVAACQYIKKSLKNSSSFELESVKAINDLNDINYYLVKVEYSATNSLGGRIDSDSFQTINKKFENPWWGLALLTGKYNEALECSPFLKNYLLNTQEPTELDPEKIMYYIDEKVN